MKMRKHDKFWYGKNPTQDAAFSGGVEYYDRARTAQYAAQFMREHGHTVHEFNVADGSKLYAIVRDNRVYVLTSRSALDHWKCVKLHKCFNGVSRFTYNKRDYFV